MRARLVGARLEGEKHANAVTTILLCRDPYTHFVQKRAGQGEGPNMQRIPH